MERNGTKKKNWIAARIVQHAKEFNQLYLSRQIERIPGVFPGNPSFYSILQEYPGFVRIPEEKLGSRLAGYIYADIVFPWR